MTVGGRMQKIALQENIEDTVPVSTEHDIPI